MNEDGTPRSGIKFGNFEVLANEDGTPLLLGGGAYGKTYKSVHSFLGTIAALKVIHDSFAYDSGVRKRFLGDAKSLARLTHPHIVKIIDCGEEDGQLYYAMEYCDGGDLEKLASTRGALSDETVLLLGKQAAKALAYVHEQGWLHRDLKPSNFMLALVSGQNEANLKLIDFGLVKALGQENAGGMTQTGQFLGTLLFASPEQLREEDLDERTDVFSLGLTLWFLLEGKLPFKGKPAQVVAQRLSGQSYHDALPKESHPVVKTLLDKMMHPDRDQRFRDMKMVLSSIEQALSELHGTGIIELPKDKPKPAQAPASTEPGEVSKVGLVTSNQRLSTRYELGEEDKEIQTDLGLRCKARQLPEGDAVHLTIVRKMLAADTLVVHHLDQMVSKASLCGGRFLIRPMAFVQFLDQLVLAEEYVEGLSLLSVLRIKRALTLPESSLILRQLAEACDLAKQAGINTLELVAHRVLFQFPRQSVGSLSGGGVERLISKPVHQWPPFLVRLAPAYTAAQKSITGSSGLANGGHMTMHAGATMVGTDEDADSPQRFARLVYRILSGHPLPVAAMMAKAAYVPIPRLSEEGNRLLSEVICSEMQVSDCLSLLTQLWRLEGLPETGLVLPKAFEDLTNVRAAGTAGVDVTVPVLPSTSDNFDVIEIPTPVPSTGAKPPPQRTNPPLATPASGSIQHLPQGGAEPLPLEKTRSGSTSSAPKPPPQAPQPPASKPPKTKGAQSQTPQTPAPAQKAAGGGSRSTAPSADTPPQPRPKPREEEQWNKVVPKATPPAVGKPRGEAAPDPSGVWTKTPAQAPPGRAPHLPPGQPGKPFPTMLVASIIGGVLVLGAVIWLAMGLLKGDPLKAAMAEYDAQQSNERLQATLREWVDNEPKARSTENARRAAAVWTELETKGKVTAEEAFSQRYDLFTRLQESELASQELEQGRDQNLITAWKVLADAHPEDETGFEARLKLTLAGKADRDALSWLRKREAASVPPRLAGDFVTVLKKELEGTLPDQKASLIKKILEVRKVMVGSRDSSQLAWEGYQLYAAHQLSKDSNAMAALTLAATDPSLVGSLPPSPEKNSLITEAARTGKVKGMELFKLYQQAGMSSDADTLLDKLVADEDPEAIRTQEDLALKSPDVNKAWDARLKRALIGEHDSAEWIASQSESLLVSKAALVKPVLDTLLASGTAKNKADLTTKIASVMRVTDQGSADLTWRLYQLFSKQGLTEQASAQLAKAKEANLPEAWQTSARMATGAQALAEWVEVATKFPDANSEAVDHLSKWVLTAKNAPADEKRYIPSVKRVLQNVPSATNAVNALTALEIDELMKPVQKLFDEGRTAEAFLDAHKAANQEGGAAQNVARLWLYNHSPVVKSPLQVPDPLVPGAVLQIKAEDWHPGNEVAFAGSDGKGTRYFKLPEAEFLPRMMANASGATRPLASGGDGTILNPYTLTSMTVPRTSWYGGAQLADEMKRPIQLPADLPLMVAALRGGQIISPFTGEPVELKDWSQWQKGGVISGPHPFQLPPDLPVLKGVATVDAMNREAISPFTKIPIPVEASKWKAGAEIPDTSSPALISVGAMIVLPDQMPLLVAKLGAKAPEVLDPGTGRTMEVPWELWKPNAVVKENQGTAKKPKMVELFTLPVSTTDPQLPGTDADGLAHTVKSPYSKKAVKVATKEIWTSRQPITDDDYPHLTFHVPEGAPEWFEPQRAKPIAGVYNRVKSPYDGDEISVTRENWRSGEVKDKSGKLALMPDIDVVTLEASVTNASAFKHRAKNPYTGEVESWPGEWEAGNEAPWAGRLRMRLPAPLPDTSRKPVTKVFSLTSVKNPWDDSTLSVSISDWNNVDIDDDDGRPIRLPNPPETAAKTVTVNKTTNTFTNPFTEKVEKWPGQATKGATTKVGKFTVVAAEVIDEINGVPQRMQRNFLTRRNNTVMKWVSAGYWTSNNGAILGGDPDEYCEDLTVSCRSDGLIPKNFVFRHVGNGRMECRPK